MSLRLTLSIILFFCCSLSLTQLLTPCSLTHRRTHTANYAELALCCRVRGSHTGALHMWRLIEFDWWASETGMWSWTRPNNPLEALTLGLTLCPPPVWNSSTIAQPLPVFNKGFVAAQKVMTSCEPIHSVSQPCLVILRLLPSSSLYSPLFVPLGGCTFICWVTDQVQRSVQRTCHEFEQKPMSAALQSHELPSLPEVTVAPGQLC